jgi:hypothetical protein
MWIDANVFDYGFEGRCPSQKQVEKMVSVGVRSGANTIELWWGENMIELNKQSGQWYGRGWIRSISGSDIAEAL